MSTAVFGDQEQAHHCRESEEGKFWAMFTDLAF